MTPLLQTWLKARASGVLAHVSSLPGDFGIGNLGPGAHAFVDFLAEAGFHYWQICPSGPTGYGDSPYQSFSSFAGNPYFIDLGELVARGLLTEADVAQLRDLPADEVDYGWLYNLFGPVLARAHDRFKALGAAAPWGGVAALEAFEQSEAWWLESYAAFMALKVRFGGVSWDRWPVEWRLWRDEISKRLSKADAAEATRQRFQQFLFARQWAALRTHAKQRGIRIIGDVPIFVAMDSADTWRWREVFRVGADGTPEAVAGVPPDYYSDRGQLWGNPLYDWEQLEATGYGWWIDRLRRTLAQCDVVRLDHFRGFDTYWEIPAGSPDARTGAWRHGPGLKFFSALRTALPEARLIAEDLGYVTPGVAQLRAEAGLPGMKVLQFAYGHDDNNVNLPHFFPQNCVVYTGTHDNDTTRGWFASLDEETRASISDYFGLDGGGSAWPVIRASFASVARLAVVPMQDLLDLPSSARLNRPGSTDGNWRWRFTTADLDALRTKRLKELRRWHVMFDRTDDPRQRDFSAPPSEIADSVHADESSANSPTPSDTRT
ncbi:MAG TPA: 4-alpha-glucanotransferase [Opitutaceae bacterium]|nr:4-alpha-glucanotransferase [Opitutaceae bacterium]